METGEKTKPEEGQAVTFWLQCKMNVPKTDNPMYKITLQIIQVKWIRIQNDINKYNTQKL